MAHNQIDLDAEDNQFREQIAAIEAEWKTERQSHLKR